LGFKAPLQHRQSRHMPSKSASKLFDHKDFLATLTSRPGVYRMLDADGAVLYVGKFNHFAQNLEYSKFEDH